MKYVVIADDIGNPIYFDHPDGRMICLPLATHHSMMNENFYESFKEMTAGPTKLVFQQYESLSFLLVSDQGEPHSVLRSQLQIVYQLLLLLFGPQNLHAKRRISFLKYQKNIQQLIDTTFQLCNDAQSVLVQSVELLEVTEEHRKKCSQGALKHMINSLPEATHALLFVGTKLVCWHFSTKSKLFSLSSLDMFLLILFLRSTFHPHVREIHTNELPVADYTDHDKLFQSAEAPILQESGEEPDETQSVDDDFDTAPEWDEEQTFAVDGDSSHSEVTDPVFLLQCGLLDEIFDESRAGQLGAGSGAGGATGDSSFSNLADSQGSTSFPFDLSHAIQQDAARLLIEGLKDDLAQGKTGDPVALIQYCLHSLGQFPDNPSDGVFGFSTAEAVQKFQKSQALPETGAADLEIIKIILKLVRAPYIARAQSAESDSDERPKTKTLRRKLGGLHLSNGGSLSASGSTADLTSSGVDIGSSPGGFSAPQTPTRDSSRDFTQIPSTPSTPGPSGIPFSPNASSIPSVPHTPKTPHHHRAPLNSLFQQLHLRAPGHTPMWVYFAEVQENTTLVIINKGLTGKDEEKEKLERASLQMREWLYKNYAGYFLAKERAHLPILQYLHHLPGLVHYIFVDRTGNRVRAPAITPLHGQSHRDPETTLKMLDKIKEQVWQLVYTSHAHLDKGYTSMVVRRGDFLYSYRLWMEDDEGVEQIINQPILPKNVSLPVGHRYFKEVVRTLFPSQSQAQQIKCYELFTLYLGILPTALVAKHDRTLITLLLEKNED